MGRPLNKKYFGRRNRAEDGTLTANDGRIGGFKIASYGTIVAGSGWTSQPAISAQPPSDPGGVTATIVPNYGAVALTTVTNGVGYDYHSTFNAYGGAIGQVSEIMVVSATVANGGTGWAVGDTWTVTGAGWSHDLIVTVATISGMGATGPAATVTLTQAGRRTAAAPTNPQNISSHTGSGSGTYNLTLTWGVYSATVTTAGSYTTFPTNPVTASGTAGASVAATFTQVSGLVSVTVTEGGDGYTGQNNVNSVSDLGLVISPAATPTNASAVGVSATPDTTTPAGSQTDREPAIIAYAYTGSTREIVDIVKQESSRRYAVRGQTTASGEAYTVRSAILVGAASSELGQMDITATDSSGKTYYVIKLTGHKAVLVPYGSSGWEFPVNSDGSYKQVRWTLGAAVANTTVKIQNA